jgi:hypothetical protein
VAENRRNNCQNSSDADHFFVATGFGPGYIRLNSMIAPGPFVLPALEMIEHVHNSCDCKVRPNSSLAGICRPSTGGEEMGSGGLKVIRI